MQEIQETWVPSLGQEDPWSRKRQPAPGFLPEKFNKQRTLVGYGLLGYKDQRGLCTMQAHACDRHYHRYLCFLLSGILYLNEGYSQ